jgi:hypothetical protein
MSAANVQPIGRLFAVEYWRQERGGKWELYRHEFIDHDEEGLPVLFAGKERIEAVGKIARGRDNFLEG